jgi:hypothetical protein
MFLLDSVKTYAVISKRRINVGSKKCYTEKVYTVTFDFGNLQIIIVMRIYIEC